MGKKSPKVPVTDFFTSLHYGVCATPDEVVDFRAAERTFFESSVTDTGSFYISELSLFGGDTEQGGVAGLVDIQFGGTNDLLTEGAARKLDFGDEVPLTPEQAPGFRGFLSLFFRGIGPGGIDTGDAVVPPEAATGGGVATGGAIRTIGDAIASGISGRVPTISGFLWGSNNPVIPPVDVRVRRTAKGLNPMYEKIIIGDFHHANPAHMLFEMLTDASYGAGVSPARINVASYEQAAETLFNEGFGLSFTWTREETIETVMADVLAHIRAVQFIDPNDGLFTLRLIRDDFVLEDLRVFDEVDIAMTDFQRKSRGEIVNSYTATYTNPISQNPETITVTDEAGVAMQEGELVAGGDNFHMIRDPDLALRVAERELRLAASPLAQGQFTGRRILSELRPGDVFVIRYPELLNEETIVARVAEIDYGRTDRPQVIVTWIEDSFTLPNTIREAREPTLWVDPGQDPAPLQFERAITLPYALATQVPDLVIDEEDFPDVVVGLLGDQSGTDTRGFDVLGEFVSASGTESIEELGRVPLTDRLELREPLIQESNTTVRISIPDGDTIVPGDFIMFGDDETTSEIVLVTATPTVDGFDFLVPVARGVLDTTPRNHEPGVDVWVLGENFAGWDSQPRTAGVEVSYALLPVTSRGRLDISLADELAYTPLDRLYEPSRPGNVTVGGDTLFGIRSYEVSPMQVPVSWSTRNRLSEDAIAVPWDESVSTTPEPGQTTRIDILSPGGVIITTISGLTGDSHNIPIGDFGPGAASIVRVSSERDGLRSFQAHEITVFFRDRSGYGGAYGAEYGA